MMELGIWDGDKVMKIGIKLFKFTSFAHFSQKQLSSNSLNSITLFKSM